jgi:hypothetical protein
MSQHDIYDEYKGLRLWNYMTCDKDEEGRETWRIRVEVMRLNEVVIPAVDGDLTYTDRGLAQLGGRVLGIKLVDGAKALAHMG